MANQRPVTVHKPSDSSPRQRIARLRRNETLQLVLSNAKIRFGGVIFLFMFAVAISAPFLAPADPNDQNLLGRLEPPGTVVDGFNHRLGTDNFGRDVLSRLMFGARMSLYIGFSVIAIAVTLGTTLGLVAGYYRGWVDDVIMRVVDIKMAFPLVVLAIAVVAVLGASANNLILALGIVLWSSPARIVRAETLKLGQLDYVAALKAIGVRDRYIMFKEIFPNLMSSLMIVATAELAAAILLEAGLSFLGLGVPPPTATWGEMLNQGRAFVFNAWWLAVFPGLAIFVTVLAINMLGDGLRDTLDPRLRM
ncbi:MAG: ABC transporter permease [Thaumarchaeota archaeon]|nr:ABC transporter permease [Nitrososphaerota archaeon]